MNRQQALEWLVQNVTKWPASTNVKSFNPKIKAPDGYWWICALGQWICCSIGAPDMEVITQQQWLDATDNMPHSDCESVFNK